MVLLRLLRYKEADQSLQMLGRSLQQKPKQQSSWSCLRTHSSGSQWQTSCLLHNPADLWHFGRTQGSSRTAPEQSQAPHSRSGSSVTIWGYALRYIHKVLERAEQLPSNWQPSERAGLCPGEQTARLAGWWEPVQAKAAQLWMVSFWVQHCQCGSVCHRLPEPCPAKIIATLPHLHRQRAFVSVPSPPSSQTRYGFYCWRR